jgi:hypothetical protein
MSAWTSHLSVHTFSDGTELHEWTAYGPSASGYVRCVGSGTAGTATAAQERADSYIAERHGAPA